MTLGDASLLFYRLNAKATILVVLCRVVLAADGANHLATTLLLYTAQTSIVI